MRGLRKEYLSCILACLLCHGVLTIDMAAQAVSFLARIPTLDGTHPNGIAAGDFFGNGRMAWVISSAPLAGSCQVTIYPGAFGRGLRGVCSIEFHAEVKTGDFNNDGQLDVVVATARLDDTDGLAVLLGDGQGHLDPPRTFAVGRNPHSITVGDFNEDQNLDLAVADTRDIYILLGDGTGDFQVSRLDTPPSELLFSAIASGDFNEDGYLDLAITTNGNQTYIFLGKGNGEFSLGQTVSMGRIAAPMVVEDFNNDGHLDIASNRIILLGDGAGGFIPHEIPGDGTRLAAGDFNEDGNLDLAFETGLVLLGNGKGDFVPAGRFNVGCEPTGIVAADFDGDGHLDFMITNWHATVPDTNPGTYSLLIGNGQGQFGSAKEFRVGQQPVALTTGDFNNDAHSDIVTANRQSSDVSVLWGDGQGDFKPGGNFAVAREPRAVTVGDFDQDGNLDIATASFANVRGPGTVSILLGDGTGGFTAAEFLAVGDSPNTIWTGDFNHDGCPDLVVSGDPITVLWGQCDGSFLVQPLAAVSPYLTIGDFDEDGNLDIAGSGGFVLFGDGRGGFEMQRFIFEGSLLAIVTGDFNADGHLDLAGRSQTGFAIWFGDGHGGFTQGPVTSEISSQSFSLADFNLDGYLDLAWTLGCPTSGNRVVISRGDGEGHFPGGRVYGFGCECSGAAPPPLVASDFNEDGRADLAIAVSSADKVFILMNNTPYP